MWPPLLFIAAMLSIVACTQNPDAITPNNVKVTAIDRPVINEIANNLRVSAENFMVFTNYARIALAKKNGTMAKIDVAEARNIITLIKSQTSGERKVAGMASGRIRYRENTAYPYHYFPIETGEIEVKNLKTGPPWAKNELAVADAEIVTITVNFTGDAADKRLDAANTAIDNGNLKSADTQLAKLIDIAVTIDKEVADPLDKATGNIALARHFVLSGNYNGASYALTHADEALNSMQQDDAYQIHRADIIAMRKSLRHLQKSLIQENQPPMQKTDEKLHHCWSELKGWN
jgi:hypothetical protein